MRSISAARRGEKGVNKALLAVAITKKPGAIKNAPPSGMAFRARVKGNLATPHTPDLPPILFFFSFCNPPLASYRSHLAAPLNTQSRFSGVCIVMTIVQVGARVKFALHPKNTLNESVTYCS
jgi:hypothetical protein